MAKLLQWTQILKRFFESSIRRKIIIPYALLTLILGVFGVFVVVRLVAGSFEARLQNQLREAAQIVSDEVVNRERTRLEIERVVVNTIGVAEAVVDRDFDTLEDLIAPVIANARFIDSIILVDTQGKELLRFQQNSAEADDFIKTTANTGSDLSDWESVSEVLADVEGFKSAQLVRDPQLDELLVYTVGPVRSSEGVVGAALVGTFLRKELASLQNVALAQLTLFDQDGKVQATTFALNDAELQTISTIFTAEKYNQVLENRNITLLDQLFFSGNGDSANTLVTDDVLDVRDQGYRLAYAPFTLRGKVYGVYGVALPTNFITDATDQSRNTLATVFALGVITVFAIGFIISDRISSPVLKLVQTSKAIISGDLNQRSGLKRADEIGVLASTFDQMTSRLQHLLQLQQEEASKLNAILQSIADGVVVQDTQGQIVVMNPAAQKILLVMERESLEHGLQEISQDNQDKTEVEIQSGSLLEYLSSFEFQTPQRLEAGNKVFSALSAPVVNVDDNARLGSVVVLRDITREYESEKLKDDFITSMSHELRTPLTAIKGYNELLKMTAAQQLNERQLDFVETIGDNVDDLLEIIQQMLDLSQIDAGNLGIDQEPLDFAELVETEVANWTAKMEERELFFAANLPDDSVWVIGDESRLTRVVHNLIKNAHNYTLPGGKVDVNVTHSNGSVQVNVHDTGVGISEENQRFLFTRFFRAIHQEHTFEISGAGLGLYTSKAVVDAHNGEMWMESELNKGSTFGFSLPVINPDTYDADS